MFVLVFRELKAACPTAVDGSDAAGVGGWGDGEAVHLLLSLCVSGRTPVRPYFQCALASRCVCVSLDPFWGAGLAL